MRTHYEVLGVSSSASTEEIRLSYLRLVMKYHPDRHQNNPLSELAAAELAALNLAHEVLMDVEKRAAYDAELAYRGARPTKGSPPHDVRSGQTLKLLLRLASVILVLLFVLRFVPLILRGMAAIWQVVAGSLSAIGGTPAVAMVILLLILLIVRWARRRTSRSASGPGGNQTPRSG